MHIRVNFLGNPRIYIDKKELFISKNKLRLLFLYILYKENCTRDELTDLFWEDLNENKGKANLRNTLYELKKLLPEGLLKIEGHHYVGIYKNVILEKDIDVFLQGNNESQLFVLKDSIFMEKIIARNNNNYNEWVQTTRGAYSGILLSSLESQLSRSMASKNNPRIREIANRILELDPVHEMAYQELIKLAIYNHSYNVGWKLYRQITQLVREELGAEPEEKTLALAEVLRSKERQSQAEKEMYFERLDLIIALKKQYEAFVNGKIYQNMVVQGELGSGKSYVVSRLMEDVKNAEVLNLVPNDEKTRGRALELLTKGDNFVLKEGALHLTSGRPLVLRIQNLQYMDVASAQEIFHNLAHRGDPLLIVAELSLSELNNQALSDFLERENLLVLEVPLLSLEQMVDYIQGLSQKVDPLSFGAIYEKSKGNMLMIHHELSGTQPMSQGERVYHSLSQKERSLLQKIALFYHGVSRGSLAKISEFTMEENLNLLSNLLKKGILVYEDGFRFKYPIYQQIVRCHMEPGIVTQYHQILAQALQPEAKTFDQLEEILYQYQQGNQVMEALGVELRLLRIKLDFTDQLFPLLKAPHELKGVSAMDPFDVYQEFDRLSQGLQNLQGRMPYEEYAQKQMEILFLKGRTMIAGGWGEEGLAHILELVERARKAKAPNYLIKAWGEQIHYGIHREDYALMKEALELGKLEIEKAQSALKDGEDDWGEELYLAKAEFTRLEGLYYLRTGALDQSIELLRASIGYYDLPRYEGYSIIPIAAAYHYMGELYALQSDYEESKTYFEKSIATIEKHHLTKSLDIFYGDYGHLLYELGDKPQAKVMLDQSLYYYEQTGNHWKRALVESLLGLLALEENNREKAMAHMRNGEIFFQKDQRKLEEKYLEELKLSLKNISISTR